MGVIASVTVEVQPPPHEKEADGVDGGSGRTAGGGNMEVRQKVGVGGVWMALKEE